MTIFIEFIILIAVNAGVDEFGRIVLIAVKCVSIHRNPF